MIITSFQNPSIKRVAAMQRGRDRVEAGLMLIEGYDELRIALASGIGLKELYYCPELMAEEQLSLLHEPGVEEAEVQEVSRPVFEKMAYRQGADGWLAVAPVVATGLEGLDVGETPLLLLCEAVEKPGNLGAMLRTADGAGADAVIAVDTPTDWGNPNIVRSSKGTLFSVPVAEATQAEALAWLKERGIKLVAATPSAEVVYTEANLTGPIAIAVGTEKQGLTAELMAAADIRVQIPMAGVIDSLNVATSAALLLYEAVRQRTAESPE